MQTWLGYTATWAGLVAAPSGIVAVILSPLAGKYMSRFDPRLFASMSFVAFSVSYFMRVNYTNDASYSVFVMPLLVQGVGMCVFFVAMLTILLDGIEPWRIPAASGLSNFLRIIAGAAGTSIVTTFWDRHAAVHQSQLAEVTSVGDPRLTQPLDTLHALGMSDLQSIGALTRSLLREAYLLSALDFFWLAGWISALMIGFVWLCKRPHGGAVVVAAD
jgi:DHA2 family multidrug resistance protein